MSAHTKETPAHNKPLRVFVVAGEASGDVLGGAILDALRTQCDALQVQGIGGPFMEKAGNFTSLIPLQRLAVMGLDILWQLPQLLQAVRQARKALSAAKPDILLTIDTPLFSMKMARAAPIGTRKIHVVAPEVWALWPGRARSMARILDHLCVLFPFEPPFFKRYGLPATYVGHPRAENALLGTTQTDNTLQKAFPELDQDKPLLLLMPGSRHSEQKTLWPLFRQVAQHAKHALPQLNIAVLKAPGAQLPDIPPGWLQADTTEDAKEMKQALMQRATAALVASGTATLELGLAGCPMVVAYRVHRLMGAVLKRFLRTKYVSLPNILLAKHVLPECLQENCTIPDLLQALIPLLNKESSWQQQKNALKGLRTLLTPKSSQETFGKRVAHIILRAKTS